ncbi:hypothetical protein C8Q72DRAFT_792216 [Fomitopsis betulina]|nr:hypothetical protein C8Q72DRAFT_792216 [Fomitopsis betulina]
MPDVGLDLDSSVGAVFIAALFSVMPQSMFFTTLASVEASSRKIRLLSTVISVSDIYILWFFVVKGHGDVFGLLSFPKLYESSAPTIRALLSWSMHLHCEMRHCMPCMRMAESDLLVSISMVSGNIAYEGETGNHVASLFGFGEVITSSCAELY